MSTFRERRREEDSVRILYRIERILEDLFEWIKRRFKPDGPGTDVQFTVMIRTVLKNEEQPMDPFPITTEENAVLDVKVTTKGGKPAKLDGDLTFEANVPEATVEKINGTSARITTPDVAGDVVVTITGDADLGEGVRPISTTVVLQVGDPQADNLNVSVSKEDKPA